MLRAYLCLMVLNIPGCDQQDQSCTYGKHDHAGNDVDIPGSVFAHPFHTYRGGQAVTHT